MSITVIFFNLLSKSIIYKHVINSPWLIILYLDSSKTIKNVE